MIAAHLGEYLGEYLGGHGWLALLSAVLVLPNRKILLPAGISLLVRMPQVAARADTELLITAASTPAGP